MEVEDITNKGYETQAEVFGSRFKTIATKIKIRDFWLKVKDKILPRYNDELILINEL